MGLTRRDVLTGAGKAAAGLTLGLAALGAVADTETSPQLSAGRKLKVVFTSGHPGDAECGCGGTIARYTDLGHDVVLLYMNRGEGYCDKPGQRSGEACGDIRTAEAKKACEILGAHAAFVGQYDGRAIVDNAQYEAFRKLYDAENPDVIFAQWPIDRHPDHRALSSLTLDAWLKSNRKATFYYYEVSEDTMMFTPAQFVDISGVESRKRAACYSHASQDPNKWYPLEEQITRFRGTQSAHAQAEGFIRHWQSRGYMLP